MLINPACVKLNEEDLAGLQSKTPWEVQRKGIKEGGREGERKKWQREKKAYIWLN